MSYTPEITEVTIVDSIGDPVAVVTWMDEVSLQVKAEGALTNANDWPDLSAAILAALTTMERSTRTHQEALHGAKPSTEQGGKL